MTEYRTEHDGASLSDMESITLEAFLVSSGFIAGYEGGLPEEERPQSPDEVPEEDLFPIVHLRLVTMDGSEHEFIAGYGDTVQLLAELLTVTAGMVERGESGDG